MAKKQGKQNQKHLVVNIHQVATPDSNARLSHAIDVLLRAAASGTSKSEGSIRGTKSPAGDTLATGEEGDVHE